MPETTWNQTVIDGVTYLVIDTAQFRIPLDFDASSSMFIAVAAPTGGLGNFPALVQGDVGPAPTLAPINPTFLEPTDPTPDSASWTELSPGVWQLDLVIHKGPQGDTGDTVIDPDDFGTPLPGKILVVNAGMDGFEYASQKVGDRYVPATIANTPSGNSKYTLCAVPIPAQGFDWRPEISGQVSITPTATDVLVDLVARLDAGGGGTPEVSGNIVGHAYGMTPRDIWGTPIPTVIVMSSGPPAAATADYDKVPAGTAAVVYFRAERVAGNGTFTTTASKSRFCVWVRPIP